MRNSNTQLPTAQELMQILTGESQRRAARYDFLLHYPHIYDAYRELARRADVPVNWIEAYADIELDTLGPTVAAVTESLSMYIRSGGAEQALLDRLFDALVVQDEVKPCEAIFVFGAPSDARIAHAVSLYDQSIAPLIVVSGKGPHYGTNELSEAERMAQCAIQHGVPERAIMIEPESITLPDNVKRTLDMWELQEFRPQRVCIVATTYIAGRARMEWYKFTPWDIEILSSPAPARLPELHRDSWYQPERGIRMLLNEYAKIILEHKVDLVRKTYESHR